MAVRGKRNEAFIGPSEFFHDCVPGDKSTTRASLWPQIQLFGKLNLSKSRRPRCSRAPSMKGRRNVPPHPVLPLYRYIGYLFATGIHGIATFVYVCTVTCMHVYLLELSGESAKNGRDIYFSVGKETFGLKGGEKGVKR